VLEKYPQQVKLVYKNFPLRNHRFAFQAAKAALAAAPQGKFWEFHDELFKNYSQLNEEKIQEIARTLQLDQPQFQAELSNPAVEKQIRDDYQQGIDLDVRGVPTVFINGRRLKDRSLEGFQQMIDKELKQIEKK
jgi:protein-disulfide isomerase